MMNKVIGLGIVSLALSGKTTLELLYLLRIGKALDSIYSSNLCLNFMHKNAIF